MAVTFRERLQHGWNALPEGNKVLTLPAPKSWTNMSLDDIFKNK